MKFLKRSLRLKRLLCKLSECALGDTMLLAGGNLQVQYRSAYFAWNFREKNSSINLPEKFIAEIIIVSRNISPPIINTIQSLFARFELGQSRAFLLWNVRFLLWLSSSCTHNSDFRLVASFKFIIKKIVISNTLVGIGSRKNCLWYMVGPQDHGQQRTLSIQVVKKICWSNSVLLGTVHFYSILNLSQNIVVRV